MVVDFFFFFLTAEASKGNNFPCRPKCRKVSKCSESSGGKAKGSFQDVSRKIFGSFNLLLNNFWMVCKQPSGSINTASRLLSGKKAEAIT